MKVRFESEKYIRAYLKREAAKIEIKEDFLHFDFEKKEETNLGILKDKFLEYILSMGSNTAKLVGRVIISFVFMLVVAIACIPPLRVLAIETASAIVRTVYIPVKTADGKYEPKAVRTDEIDIVSAKTMYTQGRSSEELTELLGFKVKEFPKELSGKYHLREKNISTSTDDTKLSVFSVTYSINDNEAELAAIRQNPQPEWEKLPLIFAIGLYPVSEDGSDTENYNIIEILDIKGKKVGCAEFPEPINGDFYNKPEGYRMKKFLFWEDEGVNYRIFIVRNDATFEELALIAEDIMELPE